MTVGVNNFDFIQTGVDFQTNGLNPAIKNHAFA